MDSPAAALLRLGRDLHPTRRLLLAAASVAVIGLVWYVGSWAARPTLVPLYVNLELGESAAMVERLTKAGITYQLEGGGTAILVSPADVARARVTLAKDGLTRGGRPGLELFDRPAWGMTDFAQRVTYQRALEGELARTIGELRGVERAQVHLVMATNSPLRRMERPASASIVLTLQGGVPLPPETVQGIAFIVSSSVEQLSPENVAVMDDAGRVLSVPTGDGVAGLTSRQLELQTSVERHLAGKVEGLLATVLGTGRARAQVSAQLSFDQVDRTIEAFDPDGQVLQSEERSEPASGTAAAPAGGQSTVNNAYQNSRRLERIIGAGGNVTRLSVAVLVDETALRGATTGAPIAVATLEGLVRNAVGLDSARGDRLVVTPMRFEPAPVADVAADDKVAAPPRDLVRTLERWLRPAVAVAAIGALLLVGWRATRASAVPAAAGGEVVGAGTPSDRPDLDLTTRRSLLQAESADRPETAAQVVRGWLAGV